MLKAILSPALAFAAVCTLNEPGILMCSSIYARASADQRPIKAQCNADDHILLIITAL